jgi:anti-sigma factor RsiW
LTCREFVDLVTDYLEDALSPEDRRRFEHHLAVCEGCQTWFSQIEETVRLTGRLTEDHLPEEVQAVVLAEFRNWKRGQ